MIIFCDFDRTLLHTDLLYKETDIGSGEPDSCIGLVIRQYVFEGVHDFLTQVGKQHTLILTSLARETYGEHNLAFQKEKIRLSNLERYFERVEVFFGADKKSLFEGLCEEYRHQRIVVIDDSPIELNQALAVCSRISCIQIRHAHTKHEHAKSVEGAYQAYVFEDVFTHIATIDASIK